MASGGSEVKVSACNAGDPGSISGSGRSPGEGNGTPLLPGDSKVGDEVGVQEECFSQTVIDLATFIRHLLSVGYLSSTSNSTFST